MAIARQDADARHHWTASDYQQLDDDTRYEILEGELIVVPAPTPSHQHAITRLGTLLDSHVSAEGLGLCFHTPFDLYLDDDVVVQPDFTFVRSERRDEVIGERGAVAPPDLVVEVLSPSTASRDRGDKRRLYAEYGVPWLLLVDPEGLTVEIYELDEGRYVWNDTASGTETFSFELFPELELDLSTVWDPRVLEERIGEEDERREALPETPDEEGG